MSFFEFPYTRTYSSDLGWLIRHVKWLTNEVENKTIKYADPIEWNITSQYEKNTVVLDGTTAYLSKEAVPSGISINNTDYWQPIFDIAPIVVALGDLRDQISAHHESSYTATANYNAGDWVFIYNGSADLLYRTTAPIAINGGMAEGVNIDKVTVEDLVNLLYVYIGDLSDLVTPDATSIVNAINSICNTIIGDLSNLITSDTSSIVSAINSILVDLGSIIGSLADLSTTDKDSIVDAINECVTRLNTLSSMIGNLANLTTSNKTSVVNAINSLNTDLSSRITALESADVIYYNVKNYGAVGDGITDDTDAVRAAVTQANLHHGIVYFPRGSYYLTGQLNFTNFGVGVMGENAQATYLLIHHNATAIRFGDGMNTKNSVSVQHIGIINYGTPTDGQYGVHFNNVVNGIMFDVIISDFKRGVGLNHAGNTALYSVGVVSTHHASTGIFITNRSVSTVIDNCYVGFMGDAIDDSYGASVTLGDIADICFRYFDVGNGIVGIYIDGQDSPADTPPTDIRIYDPVVDGARTACIYVRNIGVRGGVTIQGGWLNPLPNGTSACIKLENTYNVGIHNVLMQQLATETPNCSGIIGATVGRSVISNCRFTHLASPILLSTSSNYNEISNNVFATYSESTGYDIATDNSSYLSVNGNVSQSSRSGFINQTNGNSKCIITNNLIQNKSGTAISGANANSIVDNNIVA